MPLSGTCLKLGMLIARQHGHAMSSLADGFADAFAIAFAIAFAPLLDADCASPKPHFPKP